MTPTGTGYLLDTNIIVELTRYKRLGQFIDRTYGLSAGLHRSVISVVTAGELYSLANYFGWGEKKRGVLEEVLEELVWIDIGHPDLLRAYGEIDAACTRGGRKMGKNDAWIAATAQVTGMMLLTMDADFDFAHSQQMLSRIRIDPESCVGGAGPEVDPD